MSVLRWFPVVCVVAGGAVLAAGLLAGLWVDRGGRVVWGWQALAALGGAALVGLGLWLSPPRRRAALAWWRSAPALGRGGAVQLGAWLGVLVGLFERAHELGWRTYQDRVLNRPVECWWIAPLYYGVLFAALGALVTARRRAPRSVVVFVLLVLAAWSQALVHPSLDGGAVLLLSAGIAALVARHEGGRLPRWARRTVWPVVLWVPLCAAALWGGRAWAEGRALAALPPAPAGARNVLLVVLDTARADHLQPYGYARATSPELARLAGRGVVFEQPVAPSPWTLPSHATLFTGYYRHETSVGWQRPLDRRQRTLAEAFAAAGWRTGGFVGNLAYGGRAFGLDRGFVRWEDFELNAPICMLQHTLGRFAMHVAFGTLHAEYIRNHADTVTDRFLAWLDQGFAADDAASPRPFFAFLNYFDAHAIYDPGPPYDSMFGEIDRTGFWTNDARRVDADRMRKFVNAYDGALRKIDDQLARIVQHLADTGRLADTVIVVTGDHGEQFGEHGLMEHGNSLYRPSLHVPLVLAGPGVPVGRRVAEPVSLRDVPQTLVELAGLPPAPPFPGHTLAPLWRGAAAAPRSPCLAQVGRAIRMPAFLPVSRGDMTSLVLDRMLYIRGGDGAEELFDYTADPSSAPDVAGDPRWAPLLARARALLSEVAPGWPR